MVGPNQQTATTHEGERLEEGNGENVHGGE